MVLSLAYTTRTLNPLPFKDLEPRRFEDLVRQLAYDFRTWRSLEATGRSGNDSGYDIRGWEILPVSDIAISDNDDDEDRSLSTTEPATDRIWLIQCKREQAIGPKKLGRYFDEIPDEEKNNLYGLVFAASCNLSKKSRDLLRERCRDAGISECHVWSTSEIEDMLFQPRNDGLLFAYFGISLKIRQRSVRTKIRGRLAAKRKAYSALEGDDYAHQIVLLRDPEESRYPYLDEESERNEHDWRVLTFVGHHALGMRFQFAEYFAFLDDDDETWDMADVLNETIHPSDDPWYSQEEETQRKLLFTKIHKFWSEKIDESKRGKLKVEALISYDEILEIDRHGDNFFQGPHIYVTFRDHEIPYLSTTASLRVPAISETVDGTYRTIAPPRETWITNRQKNRIAKFLKKYRAN